MKKLLVLSALLIGAGVAKTQADSFGFSINNGGFGGFFGLGHRDNYVRVAPSCPPRYVEPCAPRYDDHARFHQELHDDHADLHRELRYERVRGASKRQLKAEHRYGHQQLREDHQDYHYYTRPW